MEVTIVFGGKKRQPWKTQVDLEREAEGMLGARTCRWAWFGDFRELTEISCASG